MKKCFFVLAAVACCACSEGVTSSLDVKDEVVELNFSVPVAATKVSGTVVEDAVKSLQVFVFGADGQVQSSGNADQNFLTLTCTTGEKTIAAIVNSPAVTGINNIDQLNSSMSEFANNSVGSFVMTGLIGVTLTASGSVEVPVSRLVSKVTLSSVTRAFELAQHQDMEFEVTSAFLTNVPEEIGYYQAQQSRQLINEGITEMDAIIAASGELLYDELSVPIAQGASEDIGNFLYCYPNMLDDPEKPAYLVVGTRLGDGVYYYSVELPEMESNKCYNVSLTVTMPGTLTPNTPVEKGNAQFSVVVSDWEENIDVNETI